MLSGRSSSTARRWNIAIIIVILASVTFFGPLRKTSAMGLVIDEDSITVTGPSDAPFTLTVAYQDIRSISETDSLDPGILLDGLDRNGCRFGSWQNAAYGEYMLCDIPDIPKHIVLETANGIVVFNYESADFTHELCSAMLSRLYGP